MGANTISNGCCSQLGSLVRATGVNFCVYAKYATRVELLLFDREDAAEPCHVVELDPAHHRTYHYWHCQIEGLGPGQIYGYRVHGPWRPEQRLRFDGRNLLLDPHGLAVVTPPGYERLLGRSSGAGLATAMKSVFACSSSIGSMHPRAARTTGAIHRFRSSPPTAATARAPIRSGRSMSSAIWSRPCTWPASR